MAPKRTSASDVTNTKKAKCDLLPLHQVQKDVSARVAAKMMENGAAYLVADPGCGKSTLLRAVLKASTAEGAVLNIISVPSAPLGTEMRTKMHFTLLPPFTSSKHESLRKAIKGVEEGTVVNIAVTHDWLRRMLSPPDSNPSNDLKHFVKAVGKPRELLLIIDEAHNLCSSSHWATMLTQAKAALAPATGVKLLLVSGTPKLDTHRFVAATQAMLGSKVEDALVAYTDEEVARFRKDTIALPAPAEPEDVSLPWHPNDGLEDLLTPTLQDLATLIVGDFVYLVGCHMEGKARRREIHSVRAMKNIVGEVLAVAAHHGPSGEATGGWVFASLEKKVPTARVVNGKPDAKTLKENESVLVVHSTARGLHKHAQLLKKLCGGENGVPFFDHHDLSLAEKNIAKDSINHKSFMNGFQDQKSGVTIGLVLPKCMEGTDKFAAVVTKVVVVGPSGNLSQIRGRFDRPCALVEGTRVRKEATKIVHLQSSWADAVLAIERIDRKASVLDVTGEIMDRLEEDAVKSKFDSETRELIAKMAMQLFKAEGGGNEEDALLPGRLVDMFFEVLKNSSSFMKWAGKDGDGPYWSIVHKYAGDTPDEPPSSDTEMEKQLEADMETDE